MKRRKRERTEKICLREEKFGVYCNSSEVRQTGREERKPGCVLEGWLCILLM